MGLEAWIQLVTGVALVGGAFYFAGELRANLNALRAIATDHEERIRQLEQER